MSAVTKPVISVENYLKRELKNEIKHDHQLIHVYAIAGTSANHDRILAMFMLSLEIN